MARNAGTVIENNFTRGLITEATGLNFPENAVTETWDCIFNPTGVVSRRKGFDIEPSAVAVAPLSTGAMVEFVWEAVAKTGTRIFFVIQIGKTLHFYELSEGVSQSSAVKDFSVDLETYQTKPSSSLAETPCAFASGNGRLFVAHAMCDPFFIEYNAESDTISETRVTIEVRDFEGVDDGLEPAEEPSTLSPEHHYNLKNQGWYPETVKVVTSIKTELI